MIAVSLGTLILLMLAVGLALVLVLWLSGVSGVHRVEKQKHQGLITCRICSVRYEEAPHATEASSVSICPACGTPNESKPIVVI
jgi:hypothetical protein